jgi:predicted DsbA family dithiol-disulfide isomerase
MAINIAASIGLDVKKLEQDFKSKEVNDMIANNKVLGYSLSVSGTPSYFIRDVNIRGAVGLEALQDVIDYTLEYKRIDDYILKEAESGNEEAYRVMLRYGLY